MLYETPQLRDLRLPGLTPEEWRTIILYLLGEGTTLPCCPILQNLHLIGAGTTQVGIVRMPLMMHRIADMLEARSSRTRAERDGGLGLLDWVKVQPPEAVSVEGFDRDSEGMRRIGLLVVGGMMVKLVLRR